MAKSITLWQDDNGINFTTEGDAEVSNAKIAFKKDYDTNNTCNGLWVGSKKVDAQDLLDYLCDNRQSVRELMLAIGI